MIANGNLSEYHEPPRRAIKLQIYMAYITYVLVLIIISVMLSAIIVTMLYRDDNNRWNSYYPCQVTGGRYYNTTEYVELTTRRAGCGLDCGSGFDISCELLIERRYCGECCTSCECSNGQVRHSYVCTAPVYYLTITIYSDGYIREYTQRQQQRYSLQVLSYLINNSDKKCWVDTYHGTVRYIDPMRISKSTIVTIWAVFGLLICVFVVLMCNTEIQPITEIRVYREHNERERNEQRDNINPLSKKYQQDIPYRPRAPTILPCEVNPDEHKQQPRLIIGEPSLCGIDEEPGEA